jgi:hypothetical protein
LLVATIQVNIMASVAVEDAVARGTVDTLNVYV